MKKENIKLILAIITTIAAIGVGVAALFIPPGGEIHSSVLYFTAQLLVFTATCLGLSMSIDTIKNQVIGWVRDENSKIEEERQNKNKNISDKDA